MEKLKFSWMIIGVCYCSAVTAAAEWTVEPSISISETYTDNLGLGSGIAGLTQSEREQFITEIEPALGISGLGQRFEIDFNYRLQKLLYGELDELNKTLNYAKTNGTAKLIGDSLMVDFNGSISQQTIDPGRRYGVSAISPGNRAQVNHITVNPYWQKQFGTSANIRIGYEYGLVEYDRDRSDPVPATQITLVDSESNGLLAVISGAPPRSPWSWNITATHRDIDYDTGAEVSLQRVGAELALSFGKTAVFIGGGDENNEFNQQLPGSPKIDGAFWNVGLRGQLDRLTNYSISAGEQHFGDSYQFSLTREAGKLTTNISYVEETSTIGQQQQGYEALFEFLSNITGADLPTPGAEVYVRKRLAAISTLRMQRSRLRLNLSNADRTYLTQTPFLGDSDSVAGVAVSWTWTALERTEFSFDAGWQGFELRDSMENPEDLRVQFRLKRKMKRGLSASLRVWQHSRSNTTPQDEYDATGVSIGITKRF